MAKRMSRQDREALEAEKTRCIQKITEFFHEKIPVIEVCKKFAMEVVRGAENGQEFGSIFDEWLEKRFKPNMVWLSREDYARALVRALWLAGNFAKTDFGTSRQRDMAQIWTDTARGFLGELAVAELLRSRFGIQVEIDTSRGKIADYLPTDIAKVLISDGWRPAQITVSIKSTKFIGRWLDIPGGQFSRSACFILTKVGISQGHFAAFLKSTGFIENLLNHEGKRLGEVTDEEIALLLGEIPDFYPLPVYISGFIKKEGLSLPVHMLNARIKGRKNKRITIEQGVGLFTPAIIQNHALFASEPKASSMLVEIEPIKKSFTGQKFLAHSGALRWTEGDWENLIRQL